MKNKLKSASFKNWGLRILAFAFAVLIWLVVENVDDPNQTKTYTTTVEIVHDEVITDAGKYYTVEDNTTTVSFRVTGKRSVMDKLTNSDFKAVADFRYMEEDGRVPIDISVERYSNVVSVSAKQHYLMITVGEKRSGKYVITPEVTGVPAEGFAVGKLDVTPNIVTISGPEEQMSRIEKVKAVCDVTGMSSDMTESVVPVLLDRNGEVIDPTELKLSVTTVNVEVTMLATKTLEIQVLTSGELSPGLELDEIVVNPARVEVKGDSASLNRLVNITIPASVVNLSQITNSLETSVDITSYLPEGVELVDSSKAQVKIFVKLTGEQKKKYKVAAGNISVKNLSEEYRAEVQDKTVEVEVSATQSQLAQLQEGAITGFVDVSGLGEGVHQVPVTFDLGEDYTTNVVSAKVKITKKVKSENEAVQERQ